MSKLNSPLFRQVLVLILFTLAVFVASTGGIQNPNWSELFRGIAVSVLAAILSIYFLQDIDRKSAIDSGEIVRAIERALGPNQTHFALAGRNMDMGEKFWIGLIDKLDSSPEPAWFVGTRLSWWLKTGTYREPLRAKLVARLKATTSGPGSADQFATYVFLADANAVPKWKKFFQEVIEDLISGKDNTKKSELEKLYWTKITIYTIPPDVIRYSAVACGDRLVVTQYVSIGRSEDSPTLDIRRDSVIRKLYMDDLELLKSKATRV